MPNPRRDQPSPPITKIPSGAWLTIGVWILLAFVNLLVVVVDGALWAVAVVIVALVLAVLTYRQARARAGA